MSGEPQGDQPRHPLPVVVRRTGVGPDHLRAREKRCAVVTPGRTRGSPRLCLVAIRELDAPGLEAALEEAWLALGLPHQRLRAIGPGRSILVFGGAAPACSRALDDIGAERVGGVSVLRTALGRLRRPPENAASHSFIAS